MSDDADKVTADDERAWDLFDRQRKAARDAEMSTVLKRVALHCLDCGAEIPAARLMAVPTAIRCVQCGTAKERTWNT